MAVHIDPILQYGVELSFLGYETYEISNNQVPLRRGKWSVEEERYATRLIKEFQGGLIPGLPSGITLRSFLSQLLHCDPMRISKKFAGGKCIGKQVFQMQHQNMETLAQHLRKTQKELEDLERQFLDKILEWPQSSPVIPRVYSKEFRFHQDGPSVLQIPVQPNYPQGNSSFPPLGIMDTKRRRMNLSKAFDNESKNFQCSHITVDGCHDDSLWFADQPEEFQVPITTGSSCEYANTTSDTSVGRSKSIADCSIDQDIFDFVIASHDQSCAFIDSLGCGEQT